MSAKLQLHIFDTSQQLVHDAAIRLVSEIHRIVDSQSLARIVLTGGSNGIALLKELSNHIDVIPWSDVHFYFGDERFVPNDSPDRNAKQAFEALFNSIPAAHVYPIPSNEVMSIDKAADDYAQLLASHGNGTPVQFDIHLFGMGDEGHINSLFPNSPATNEQIKWVVPVTDSPKPPQQRITLTFPAINRTKQAWFLVTGRDKANAVREAITGADYHDWPAAGAHGIESTAWFLDSTAASAVIPQH